MPSSRETARLRAREILAALEIYRPPVPIEKIARILGIQLQYGPLDERLSGMAYIKDDVAVIGVNSLHHPNRQRFTIAHELAHHVLHPDQLRATVHVDTVILRRDSLATAGVDDTEIEANAFAAEILMPEHMIEASVPGGIDLIDDVKVADLSRKFRVSQSAMQFRLMAVR